ncbi:SWPV1-029 [Shearwaterpox virus]|uniref:SWPV1-029 n=1 Tax=Shearwaterpox virus TaxID=1974596 RepID=A0A1V0S7P5_CNPV|nr:SWPV1-029 [Shearwaterpox virus]
MDYEYYNNYSYIYNDIINSSPRRILPSKASYIIVLIIYFITFSIGISFNTAVIWLTGFKWPRSITTYLFLNLAVSNFLLVVCVPLEIIYILMDFHWPFGHFVCKTSSFIFHTGAYSSIFILMIISVDRYCSSFHIELCYVYRFQRIVSIIICIMWIISMTLSFPHYYFKTIQKMGDTVDCFDDFHKDRDISISIRNTLSSISFIAGYAIPGNIFIFCYYNLAVNNRRLSKGHFYTILLLMSAFFICWTPYNALKLSEIINSFYYYNADIIDINIISTSIVFLNSCINPIIYVFLSKFLQFNRVSIEDSLKLILSEETDNSNSV